MPKVSHWPHVMTIRLNDELKGAVKDRAEEEDVSMTDVIRGLVIQEFGNEPALI